MKNFHGRRFLLAAVVLPILFGCVGTGLKQPSSQLKSQETSRNVILSPGLGYRWNSLDGCVSISRELRQIEEEVSLLKQAEAESSR